MIPIHIKKNLHWHLFWNLIPIIIPEKSINFDVHLNKFANVRVGIPPWLSNKMLEGISMSSRQKKYFILISKLLFCAQDYIIYRVNVTDTEN